MTGSPRAEAAGAPRGERALAIGLTAAVAALAAVRMLYAGGLWRDEAGAARLATLPTLREVVGSFPHEAFPPLFPLAVRAYTHLAGGGDVALRAFGLGVAVAIAGVLWMNARVARTVPLLSLALLGLDVPFIVFGDSLRGYGVGSALILLTYGLLARCLAEPPDGPPARRRPFAAVAALAGTGTNTRALLLMAAAVASVQVVLSNAALLLALCAAAAAVALARRHRRRRRLAAWIGLCGIVAALSLLPYAGELAAARRQWSPILVYPIGARRIWWAFAATVGPRPVLAAWLLLVVVGLAGVVRELWRRRGVSDAGDAGDRARPIDLAAFAGLAIVLAVVAEGTFLKTLGYRPRPWYLLPLLALLASALDTLFAVLARPAGSRPAGWLSFVRPAAVALVAAAQIVPLARGLTVRQTNADLVARAVERSAAPRDLVVVLPWYYGVSFDRYYRGAARWLTLPEIADHRIHRYDLLKARLAAENPLDDLLQAVAATLRSGHQVWLVGDVRWPRPGEQPPIRPPAPLSPDGWHDRPYLLDWSRQLGGFLERHGGIAVPVDVPAGARVSELEDMPLAVVRGWREEGPVGPDQPGSRASSSATSRPGATRR
jgi:hypothetical protein